MLIERLTWRDPFGIFTDHADLGYAASPIKLLGFPSKTRTPLWDIEERFDYVIEMFKEFESDGDNQEAILLFTSCSQHLSVKVELSSKLYKLANHLAILCEPNPGVTNFGIDPALMEQYSGDLKRFDEYGKLKTSKETQTKITDFAQDQSNGEKSGGKSDDEDSEEANKKPARQVTDTGKEPATQDGEELEDSDQE